jgi:hypothetical protein
MIPNIEEKNWQFRALAAFRICLRAMINRLRKVFVGEKFEQKSKIYPSVTSVEFWWEKNCLLYIALELEDRSKFTFLLWFKKKKKGACIIKKGISKYKRQRVFYPHKQIWELDYLVSRVDYTDKNGLVTVLRLKKHGRKGYSVIVSPLYYR